MFDFLGPERLLRADSHRQMYRTLKAFTERRGEPLIGEFDVIVSNPPYVAENDPHLDQGDLRFEPRVALTPGGDGLAAIREITGQAQDQLREDGWLMFEHGLDQAEAVRDILKEHGFDEVGLPGCGHAARHGHRSARLGEIDVCAAIGGDHWIAGGSHRPHPLASRLGRAECRGKDRGLP